MIDFSTVAGGIAFILLGVKIMTHSAAQVSEIAGAGFAKGTTVTAFSVFGMVATLILQSSSAVTSIISVMCGTGMCSLLQAFGAVVGANIGTTGTAWICAALGIGQSGNVLTYAVAAAVGILLMSLKSRAANCLGYITAGIVFFLNGAELLTSSAAVAGVNGIADSNCFISMVYGILFTVVIQSSSAGICVLQALSVSGGLSLKSALFIIAGMNIGTCSTALIACLADKSVSKGVPVFNLIFNAASAVLILPVIWISGTDMPVTPAWIAVLHSSYNIVGAVATLPVLEYINRKSGRF